MKRWFVTCGALMLFGFVRADTLAAPTIRIWGDPSLGKVIGLWEAGFKRSHPDAQFETTLKGTDTAMAGLYTAKADIAFLTREVTPVEVMAFAWIYHYPPRSTEVMTGGMGSTGKAEALVVLVNRGNPVEGLSLLQLDAIYGSQRRRGAPSAVRTWAQLGMKAPWSNQPVHPYLRTTESDSSDFVRRVVLMGSRKWNWDSLVEFYDAEAGTSGGDADRAVAEAVAHDRDGIGICSVSVVPDGAKVISLRASEGTDFVMPTRDTVASRAYPLARAVYAYFNAAPQAPADSKVGSFLKFILSPTGQEGVRQEGEFLPLPPDLAQTRLGDLANAKPQS